ncbi:MAG TPA: hybrid sensor histidine kinase/response regulator, partial [Paraburkholderia sp.]|nr:hybrid sensor histidine kinase/response regulator [Paraburkholderia sp.]
QDLVMPGIDGLDLVRRYRSNPLTVSVPIVVLSSKEHPTVKSEAFVAGANDYLVKMPDTIELIARIRYHSKSYVSLWQRDHALDFLSHDMRSPQTSILALIEMYRQEHGELSPVLERIAAHAANALELAEGFTQLTRVQSEWRQFEMVNLNDLLVTAVDQLWEKAIGKGCRISVDAPDTELMVLCDRMLLTRLVTNLIDNALKYGPPDSEVRCILSSTPEGLLIAVEDEGAGIPQKDADRVAERFVRLPGGGLNEEKGFGLGLAFVNVVAIKHRGRMIMNRTARGFLIGALLPAVEEAPLKPAEPGHV